MPDREDETTHLEMAHVLFMDLVGYSRLSVEEQSRRIGALQEIVRSCPVYREAESEETVLAHPAGDGMALAFFRDPSSPARCALAVAEAIAARDDLPLRMGIHSGPVHRAEDINRTANVRGPGINVAQRVMDCGDAGHILLSYVVAESLSESEVWSPRLHDLGEVEVKHGLRVRLFSLADGDIGDPATPTRVRALREQWSEEHRNHNLPASLTSFIGREGQVEEVKGRLRETRLLTLTGTGGTGKTRLSMRVGEESLDEYPDGVWFVELASISDPDLVINVVAAVLGVQDGPGTPVPEVREPSAQPLMARLTQYLRTRQALLILDNCEHLVEGAARVAEALLLECPDLRILATSREVLGVSGEATWRVPPLSMPGRDEDGAGLVGAEFEAMRLFVDRARAAKADFALTDENAGAVAAICRRLDGIPLAIELAAARVRAMSVEQIHERLDDRFRLLTGGGRTSARRQQTLRALVDWSYRLLDEPQQAVFCRLSAFADGFTMEAAEDVCAFGEVESWDVLDLLLRLVDKSLVIVEEGGAGPRYRMLETLREYGGERLVETGEARQVRERHFDHFAGFVHEAAPKFRAAAAIDAMDSVADDYGNIRQALEWTREAPDRRGADLVDALGQFWVSRGHYSECREWCGLYLSSGVDLDARCGASIRCYLADGLLGAAEHVKGRKIAEEALSTFEDLEDRPGIARAWYLLGYGHTRHGGYEQGRKYFEDALAICRESDDDFRLLEILPVAAVSAAYYGEADHAWALCLEGLPLAQEHGHVLAESVCLLAKGTLEMTMGDHAGAEESCERAVRLARDGRSDLIVAHGLRWQGLVAGAQQDYASAYSYTQESCRLFRKMGSYGEVPYQLRVLAALDTLLGNGSRARIHWAEAEAAASALGWGAFLCRLGVTDLNLVDGDLASAARDLQYVRGVLLEAPHGPGLRQYIVRCGRLAVIRGERDLGTTLLSVGETSLLGVTRRDPIHALESRRLEAAAADARERMSAASFSAAWERGKELSVEEAADLADQVVGA
ncbi:hypothetical protein CMK11_04250 [Candidatus Poribacteria bacterium]|nr:hypothetical protein [Candidatus Poribacteria bacterium]